MASSLAAIVSTLGADSATRQRVSRAARDGHVRRITTGLYTTQLSEPLTDVVRRHAYEIAGILYPGGVIGYRTALEGGVRSRDVLFITHSSSTRRLPGLTFRTNDGPGPLPEDMPLGETLYLSSIERCLLENLSPSRARSGIARAAGGEAVEEYLDRRASIRGVDELQVIRDRARVIAPQLGLENEARALDRIIASLQGTNPVAAPLTAAGKARARGEPVDSHRVADFEAIAVAIHSLNTEMILRPVFEAPDEARHYWRNAAFFESYFSNYIEGTEFAVEEARAIVFDAVMPENRPADAHDILGVYAIVADERTAMRTPGSAAELLQQLQEWHHDLFSGRPDIRPGELKWMRNRAGDYDFVAPEQVRGTLKAGFAIADKIQDPVGRAVFMHHLVSEVHPFDDGNGRLSRLVMNAELSRSGLTRVIIPTILRDDYLAAVRLLSRSREPASLQRVIETTQRLHNAVPMADYDAALATLGHAQAFERPSSETRFVMPKAATSDHRTSAGPGFEPG